MWFKNISAFSVERELPDNFDGMLAEHQLREPGPLEQESRGFVSPFARDGAALSHSSHGCTLFCAGNESRMLPAPVLNAEVAKRIAQHEEMNWRKPGRRARLELRDAAVAELLPRAFIKRSRTGAYFDSEMGMLIVDTASDSAAEDVVTMVRDALGSFPARPLSCEMSITLLMTEWLIAGQLPDGFEFGDECELKDPSDYAMVVRCRRHDITQDEIREHARCGKRVTQLGLIFDGRIGFVLDDKLKLRKLRFLDVVADKLDAQDGADAEQILDAEFALMSLELRNLLKRMDSIFKFNK